MESLSNSLQPYKDLIAQAASILTIGQFFSGGFICKDIYKNGSTKGISAVPFIGGIVVGIVMLKYAVILNDITMLQVNVAAVALNLIYITIYYMYSQQKWEELYLPSSYGTALIVASLSYAGWEHPDNLEFRYGMYVTVLMLALLGAPLKDLKEIIATKDASSIPFPMTFMGVIVTFLWLLYGIVLLNYFMIVQNVIGFVICFIQLLLIFVYPSPKGNTSSGQRKKQKKAVKKD